MDRQIAEQSILDIKQSAKEIAEFIDYLISELEKWKGQLDNAGYLPEELKALALRQYEHASGEIQAVREEMGLLQKNLAIADPDNLTEEKLDELINKKKAIHKKLRFCISLFSSTVISLNWQSPAIKSSQNTRMGIEKYPVQGDYNDYKRDRSGDAFYNEEMMAKRLIKINNRVKPTLNLCNCGMATFTSILYFLTGENIIKDKVLASSNIYVENILVLKNFLKDKLETFDYNDTDRIVNKIFSDKPQAVFMDVISNTFDMPLFDVASIIKEVAKNYKEDIYFVIDVTCSIGYEDLLVDFDIPDNIKIIIHGSILKAPQLGMERTYAGFVLSFGLDNFECKILEYRTLSGCTLHDCGEYLLPITTKGLLLKRLNTIERNTIILANFLTGLDPDNKIIKEVVYPGISSHKDHDMCKKIGFSGPFFNVKFLPDYNMDKYFESFTDKIIKYATEYSCDIVHGASYGFNETSIYYSVGWDTPDKHYLRFSIGTETMYEIEKIKRVLEKAFTDFKNEISLTANAKS